MNEKTIVHIALFALLGAFALGGSASPARAAGVGGNFLTGELVVISEQARTFRLVGNDNRQFVAPAGVELDALDGKPVIVQLDAKGHVESIDPKHVEYKPITHGITTIYGELRVVDVTEHRFRIEGESGTYVAPDGIDVRPYAGKRVKIEIGDAGQVTDLHLAGVGEGEAAPARPEMVPGHSGAAPY